MFVKKEIENAESSKEKSDISCNLIIQSEDSAKQNPKFFDVVHDQK
jgi:hypothetical protein